MGASLLSSSLINKTLLLCSFCCLWLLFFHVHDFHFQHHETNFPAIITASRSEFSWSNHLPKVSSLNTAALGTTTSTHEPLGVIPDSNHNRWYFCSINCSIDNSYKLFFIYNHTQAQISFNEMYLWPRTPLHQIFWHTCHRFSVCSHLVNLVLTWGLGSQGRRRNWVLGGICNGVNVSIPLKS